MRKTSTPRKVNLFERLMPGGDSEQQNQPKSFGREDYITEVVAHVLLADTEAGGSLCAHVVSRLFGISLNGKPRIATQTSYKRSGAGESWIDMEIRTADQVIFFENKTGSPIGARFTEASGENIDQITKYQRELDQLAVKERYLVMIVWAPQGVPTSARYWHGYRYWWDLFSEVAEAPLSGDAYSDGLREEMLEFFRIIQLDPPTPLNHKNAEDVTTIHRILAHAITNAQSTHDRAAIIKPRPGAMGHYLFEMPVGSGTRSATWTFGFRRGELFASVSNEGYRKTNISDEFFDKCVDEQIAELSTIILNLPASPSDPSKRGALSEEVFLNAFEEARAVVESLLRNAEDSGWKINIGSSEASLSSSCPYWIYLSAGYGGGPQVRIWCKDRELQDTLKGKLIAEGFAKSIKSTGESIKFSIASANLSKLPYLPKLLYGVAA